MARHLLTPLRLKAQYKDAWAQALEKNTRIRLSDGDRLLLEVRPSGSASWQFMYVPAGKSKRAYTIGNYPGISLATAREVADQVRNKIALGIDPNEEKKSARAELVVEAVTGRTVREIGEDLIADKQRHKLSDVYLRDIERAFNADLYPTLGDRVAKTVTGDEIESLLRTIETRGAHVQMRRFNGWIRAAFALAKRHGVAVNPCPTEFSGFLRPTKTKSRPGLIEPRELAQLLRSLQGYTGSDVSSTALLIHAHTFVRPTELQQANWSSVEENTWHVNVVLELGKFDHLVPLTRQSKALFERLRHLHPQYVVPGRRHGQRISEATLNAALHALGFKDKHCTHGFRTSASTLLGEMGWDRALIERQLSHQLMDRVEAAYNKGKFLPQRKRMLQCWSDYLDALIDQTTGAENQQPDEWYQQWSLTNSA